MDTVKEQMIQALRDDEFLGACLACGAIAYGVESDAEGYHCDECGKDCVSGALNYLLEGDIVK